MDKYLVTSAPHVRNSATVLSQNLYFIFALLPCVICSVIFTGIDSLLLILVSVASAYVFDLLFSYLILGKFNYKDISSLLTGLTLGLVLPVKLPIYFALVASFIAVVLAKVVFGGEGKGCVDGVSLGVTVLAAIIAGFTTELCAYTAATGDLVESPLKLFAEGEFGAVPITSLILGNGGGLIGTTCIIAIVIGGVFLCCMKIIDWYMPLLSIVTFVITTLITKGQTQFLPELFAGSFVFVSFFIMPTRTGAPTIWISKFVYAIVFGLIVAFTRNAYVFGEAGVFLCVLLVNLLSPVLDWVFGLFYQGRRVKKYE